MLVNGDGTICWGTVSQRKLPIEFVRRHARQIRWVEYSKICPISLDFITEFRSYIKFGRISCRPDIPIEVLEKFGDSLSWGDVSNFIKLTPEIFKRFKHMFNFGALVYNRTFYKLPFDLITENICRINWDTVSQMDLPIEFMEKFQGFLYWDKISTSSHLTIEKMHKFKDLINWKKMTRNIVINNKVMEEFADYLDWKEVSKYQKISAKVIEKHINDVYTKEICIHSKLPMWFIRKYLNILDIRYLCSHQRLNEKFILQFSNILMWPYVCECQRLTSKIIINNIDKIDFDIFTNHNRRMKNSEIAKIMKQVLTTIDSSHKDYWELISQFGVLTEDFINDNIDKLNTDLLVRHQKLNETFLKKFYNKIHNKRDISTYQKISEDLLEEWDLV